MVAQLLEAQGVQEDEKRKCLHWNHLQNDYFDKTFSEINTYFRDNLSEFMKSINTKIREHFEFICVFQSS